MRMLLVLLLGAGGALVPSQARSQGCPLPAEFTHSSTFDDGGLITTLAVTKSEYVVGDSITFWLSFDNQSDSVRTIPNPSMITPLKSIRLVPATCDSSTDEGCFDACLFWVPEFYFYFGVPIVLDPGACSSLAITWHGVPRFTETTSPGSYVAFAGADDGWEIFYPPHGVRLEIQILPGPTPVVPSTWGNLKGRFQ